MVLGLLLVVLIAVVTWDAISIQRMRARAAAEAEAEARQELSEVAAVSQASLLDVAGDLRALTNSLPEAWIQRALEDVANGADDGTGGPSSELETSLRAVVDQKDYQRVRLFGPDGSVLVEVAGHGLPLGPSDSELEAWWNSEEVAGGWHEEGEVHLALYGLGAFAPTLALWSHLVDDAGAPVGAILIETNAVQVLNSYSVSSPEADFALTSADGAVLLRLREALSHEDATIHTEATLAELVDEEQVQGVHEHLIAYVALDFGRLVAAPDWRLMVVVDRPGVPVGETATLLGQSALGLVIAVVTAYWLLRLVERSRMSEQRYRELVEQSPDGIMLQTRDGIVYANQTAAELLGAPSTRALGGMDTRALVHEDSLERVAELLDRQRPASTGVVEVDIVRFDGERRSMEGVAIQTTYGARPALQIVFRDISARKEMERELQFAQSWQSRILEVSAESVISVNARGRIILFNRTAEQAFGYAADEAIGQPLEMLIPPGYRDGHAHLLAHFAAGSDADFATKASRSIPALRKDGSTFPTSASVSKVGSGDQQVLTVTMRDITQEVEAEREIRSSRERLRMVLENVPVAVSAYDHEGRLIFRGGAGAELLEASSEALGPVMDVTPEEYSHLRDALSGKRSRLASVREGRHLEVHFEPVHDDDDAVTAVVSVAADVTELAAAQEALREEYRQTEQVLAAISSALIGVREDGTISLWNDAAERLLGVESGVATGSELASLPVEWGDRWELLGAVQRCVDDGEPQRIEEFGYEHADGEHRVLAVAVTAVTDAEGVRRGALIAARDITERLLLERQLAQSQKLESIGELAAGIAHEINTPTQFVGDNVRFLRDSFAELIPLCDAQVRLLDAVVSGAVTEELVHEVQSAITEADIEFLREEVPSAITQTLEGVERVATIVRAMKDFSHPGNGEKEPTDLNHALESTSTVARSEWKYLAELELDLSPDLPMVPCLAGELNQAFLNIIINAAHAIAEATGGHEQGLIRISTAVVDDQAEIRISDNGPGIPEAIRERVFDPFFTTKGVGRGTGQGLAIARSVVVDKHGGSLSIETRYGEGTTFVIRLPLRDEAAEAA